jgi:succinate-semialdehyde dehydrogenase/glutarate-semialdehyde dehydrogenase
MPWNFPFWQVLRFAAPTIAAGNSIVVKHASNVPICAKEIEDVFLEAGFRKGTYTNLVISSSVATALVDKNLVEGISFTGSTEVGSKIGEMAGRNIKKVVLELGGSDPYIVLNGADVKKAAQMAVTARFQNCGQSCVAAKRFIIDREITEEFTSELLAGIDNLVMGDPSDSKTTLGPMARADLRKELANQLQEMKNEGAKVLTGGKMPSRKGYYFEPTVIESNKKSEAAMKETFGPVATIMIAKDIDEAIEIANMTEYGLGASLWTNDKSETLVRKIDAGFVVVNNMVKSDPAVPFGGIKRSGLGRELGKEGIYEFVNKKSVLIN